MNLYVMGMCICNYYELLSKPVPFYFASSRSNRTGKLTAEQFHRPTRQQVLGKALSIGPGEPVVTGLKKRRPNPHPPFRNYVTTHVIIPGTRILTVGAAD